MTAMTPELIREHGLSDAEYARIKTLLGRDANLVELGVFSVMWSEHCSYKSTRAHLKKLPTKGPQVIQGPGENAGVIDIGDGDACIFKMESHNHPSFIEPYQGAATGVGGIMRDVFTMGARPIAMMNALRFGEPDHPKTRHLVSDEVLDALGPGWVVNVSRGAVVDEPALVARLVDGRLLGAGLDVFGQEPLPTQSVLWQLPNVVCTPHMAGMSPRYARRLAELLTHNLLAFDGRASWRNRVC